MADCVGSRSIWTTATQIVCSHMRTGAREIMKSKLLKVVLFATSTIALGALASPSLAKTYKYQFGTNSGGGFCDGLTITNGGSGKIWTGTHTGSCEDGDGAGGFTVKIEGSVYIEINTTDKANDPGVFETFLLQPKTDLWYLYTNDGSGFELVNEGKLIKGTPPAGKQPSAKPSIVKNPKAVDKPFF
jgi:hypothetical protein